MAPGRQKAVEAVSITDGNRGNAGWVFRLVGDSVANIEAGDDIEKQDYPFKKSVGRL